MLPTLRRPGEHIPLGYQSRRFMGQSDTPGTGPLSFAEQLSRSITDCPKLSTTLWEKNRSHWISYPAEQTGTLRIRMLNDNEQLCGRSGSVADPRLAIFPVIGVICTARVANLSVSRLRASISILPAINRFSTLPAHQANDFQVNNAFWKYLNELTAEYHEDGRFVVFPGYEWSGNTAVGGDRNVFFREEGRQIHRSSHALISDRSDLHTDAPTATKLFESLQGEDCVVYAHVGGRYADITQAHDPTLETAMEIHSAWGTFEWLLTDGFPLSHRSGVVCNSDGHKGRPGASYPGAATFGAYGGLTCFLTDDLSRDSIFECLRRRHHYGTTGCRLHMDVTAHFDQAATVFARDPNVFPDSDSWQTNEVMMGDIVSSSADSVELHFNIAAHTAIERVEVRNGTDVLKTVRPYQQQDLGNRIRVIWSGAEYRGRGRQTNWIGRACFRNCLIRKMTKINAWNHERLLEQRGSNTVEWNAMTTGNYGGFDAWLDVTDNAALDLTSNHGAINKPLEDIGFEDTVLDAGGLERKIRVFRLPEHNPYRELQYNLQIPLKSSGDNPLWICVTTEDGFQAWSSPIFVYCS